MIEVVYKQEYPLYLFIQQTCMFWQQVAEKQIVWILCGKTGFQKDIPILLCPTQLVYNPNLHFTVTKKLVLTSKILSYFGNKIDLCILKYLYI